MDANALTDKLNRALLDLGDTPDTVALQEEVQAGTGVSDLFTAARGWAMVETTKG